MWIISILRFDLTFDSLYLTIIIAIFAGENERITKSIKYIITLFTSSLYKRSVPKLLFVQKRVSKVLLDIIFIGDSKIPLYVRMKHHLKRQVHQHEYQFGHSRPIVEHNDQNKVESFPEPAYDFPEEAGKSVGRLIGHSTFHGRFPLLKFTLRRKRFYRPEIPASLFQQSKRQVDQSHRSKKKRNSYVNLTLSEIARTLETKRKVERKSTGECSFNNRDMLYCYQAVIIQSAYRTYTLLMTARAASCVDYLIVRYDYSLRTVR